MRMPNDITKKISQRAVEIARGLAPRKTGLGASRLIPSSEEGEIGIEIPPDVHYMLYQDQGTQPHIQWELAGKTIPIRNANGTINFRRATDSNIGQRKILSRNEKGQIIKSKLSWRHPGIKGTQFIERSLRQATSEWAQTTNGQEVIRMLDQSDAQELMDILKGRN